MHAFMQLPESKVIEYDFAGPIYVAEGREIDGALWFAHEGRTLADGTIAHVSYEERFGYELDGTKRLLQIKVTIRIIGPEALSFFTHGHREISLGPARGKFYGWCDHFETDGDTSTGEALFRLTSSEHVSAFQPVVHA